MINKEDTIGWLSSNKQYNPSCMTFLFKFIEANILFCNYDCLFHFRLHLTISKHHIKYGPLFKIQIGNVNAVFIKDPDMMRSVFAYEGKFPKHPLPEAWTYFNEKRKCKRGLFFM